MSYRERLIQVIEENLGRCACGHWASGEHNSEGCYARISYDPLVKCDCKRDHGGDTEAEVIADALLDSGLL